MIVRWNRIPGATSYKITVSPKSAPGVPAAFAQYGPNTVMGSVTPLSPNVDYVVTVEAQDDQGSLSSTNLESFTAPEVAAGIDRVKALDSTSLMVDFTPVTGATAYRVRVQSHGDRSFREVEVHSSPVRIDSLQPYTAYSVSILSVNSGGQSQPSNAVIAMTLLPPPQLSTSSYTNSSIFVSWLPEANAAGIYVNVAPFTGGLMKSMNSTSTPAGLTLVHNHTVTELLPSVLYTVHGYFWDSQGNMGEPSPNINQTTRPSTPSLAGISVERGAGWAGLNVSWEPVQQEYGHLEYQVTSNHGPQCTSTDSSCTLVPVGCAQTHHIHMVAINAAGPSTPTDPVTFATFPCPPESLAVVETTPGNCTFSWDWAPYAVGYNAFIKRSDGGEETCNTSSTSCQFLCECGYTYLASVLAYNDAGLSDPGPVVNYTTLPCCPTNVAITVETTDTFEITWAVSRGADLYETHAADGSMALVCNDTAPVCVLSDLRCDRRYTLHVNPCSETSGCNRDCPPHVQETPPCTPGDLQVTSGNGSSVTVSWMANNQAAIYTARATAPQGTHTCSSNASSCDLDHLPCGSSYSVIAVAHNAAGQSLPSYSVPLETAPCCPANLTVDQVTQAMSNASWSHARGAASFITTLTSPRGSARCHTQDPHCLLGCITCGTNYSVSMEAYSSTGHMALCTYQGFASSACCASGIKLYMRANNTLRVYWRPSGGGHNYTVEMTGSSNYTCSPQPGRSSCDLDQVQCGEVYTVLVNPLTADGTKVDFCQQRMYLVTCAGNNLGMVIYRGKRSVD
ncbi:unnamed protein product [Merluccius merluccius]